MTSRRIIVVATFALLSGTAVTARAQEDYRPAAPAPSVADAARKARSQKKEGQTAKVFTNDNMSEVKGTISVVGADAAPGSDQPAENSEKSDKKAAQVGTGQNNESYWRAKFSSARKRLADDTRELDILQREFNLKQEQFYQDPTAAMKQQYSREDLNKAQADIDAKKQDVEKDKQALSDLEDEMRKAGGEPGWATEASGTGLSASADSNGSGNENQPAQNSAASNSDSGSSNSGNSDHNSSH